MTTKTHRRVTISIPVGDWKLIQAKGEVSVRLNLDNMTTDTIERLFNKGLTLAIRNAYASAKTPSERQMLATAKALDLCANVWKSGSNSQWTQLQSAMIRTYVNRKYNGTMPQGGMHKAWQEIEDLSDDKRERLSQVAQQSIELDF